MTETKQTSTTKTDRREALMGADYVISTFLIGGMRAYQVDYEVPLKYGAKVRHMFQKVM